MEARLAHIRRAAGIDGHFLSQTLELPAADVLEVDSFGRPCRGFVKIHRHPVAAPDLLAHALGDLHALLEAHALDGDEGHHVGRPDARVHARMAVEVDQFDRLPDCAQRRLAHRFGRPGEGQHRTVVIGVELAVEEDHARHRPHGFDERVHFGGVPPLREVRHALDQSSGHSTSPSRYSTRPLLMVMATRFTPK